MWVLSFGISVDSPSIQPSIRPAVNPFVRPSIHLHMLHTCMHACHIRGTCFGVCYKSSSLGSLQSTRLIFEKEKAFRTKVAISWTKEDMARNCQVCCTNNPRNGFDYAVIQLRFKKFMLAHPMIQ